MYKRTFATLILSLLSYHVAGATSEAAMSTFTGIVSDISATSLDVADAGTGERMRFLITPADKFGVMVGGVLSKHPASEIKVGWRIAVTFDTGSVGTARHALLILYIGEQARQ